MLQFKLMNNDDCQFVERLYLEAFPSDERLPYDYLMKKVNQNKAEFLSLYDNNLWIGLAYTITYQQLTYLFYFAIDKSKRGKGYGSQALELLKQRYQHTLMLSIEEVNEKYDNYFQRVKRKEFYFRNGMKDMDFSFVEDGVRFEMLYSGQLLSKQDYDQLMFYFMGQKYLKFRLFEY